MNPVSVDIKDILVKECGFVFAQDLFISAIPAEPYNCVVIYDTSNEEIQNTYDNENYRFESIMIWVRDVDYGSAYIKANSIISVLNNKANFVINGSRYLYCSMCSGINGIEGFADTNILTMNFRLQRKATNEFDTEYLTFEKLVNILKEGENITFTITPDKQIYINGGIPEAPIDGNKYARKDAGWVEISGGGGGGLDKTFQTLTEEATITFDASVSVNGSVTLTNSRILGNITNAVAGEIHCVKVIQGGSGGYALTYDNQYKFSGGVVPTLSATVGAVDLLFFLAVSTSEFHFINAIFDLQTP